MTVKQYVCVAALAAITSTVALTATAHGSIAFTGYAAVNNGNAFSFVTLADLPAGQVIYFTDNGWTTSNTFRGASATLGAGSEQLIRFTVNSTITAGTVVRTTANDPSWTWTRSGTIGTTSSSYADLQLAGADQITAFLSTNTSNPLLNWSSLLANLDWTGAYETSPAANNSAQVPTSILPSISAVLLNNVSATRRGQFNLNALSSGTQTQWLLAISDPANWTSDNLTTPLSGGSIQVIPAPGAAALLGLGGLMASRRRRS
ncbi:MAG: hypothetical protein K2X32_04375 [Phycisphaerales bacterium]|nr:hypothetical protein [Phycisphaerales bacterium]